MPPHPLTLDLASHPCECHFWAKATRRKEGLPHAGSFPSRQRGVKHPHAPEAEGDTGRKEAGSEPVLPFF